MKLSLIISSFNQRKRLKLSLQSALNQKLGPNATSYEVIVADDCSTDGTIELLKEMGVKYTQNPHATKNVYTLAENWNTAAAIATGDRYIFSNGDIVYISKFIEAHADPIMADHIILGPAMRTTPHVLPLINSEEYNHYQLMKAVSDNKWYAPDMRWGRIAHTYNKEEDPWNVYGYNFSVPTKYFKGVNGFDVKRRYGGEDVELAKKIVKQYNCKCLTNENTMAFHLYHPTVNHHETDVKPNYSL
jgi:glycosyltransferase involved in cell wall biosynthesis